MRANHFVIPPISSDHQPQMIEPKAGAARPVHADAVGTEVTDARAQVI